jgi:predicted PurR-regulated permease PerM
MTFAEITILVVVASVIYLVLKPLQQRLEKRLYIFFRSKFKGKSKTVIDITDYSKKKDPDQ